MNGPAHFREAERLLRGTTAYYNGGQTVQQQPATPEAVARAHVHALLALTAATLDARYHRTGDSPTRDQQWREAMT